MTTIHADTCSLTESRESARAHPIVDRAEAVQGIRRGLESMARGQGLPAREACEKLRARHGIDTYTQMATDDEDWSDWQNLPDEDQL